MQPRPQHRACPARYKDVQGQCFRRKPRKPGRTENRRTDTGTTMKSQTKQGAEWRECPDAREKGRHHRCEGSIGCRLCRGLDGGRGQCAQPMRTRSQIRSHTCHTSCFTPEAIGQQQDRPRDSTVGGSGGVYSCITQCVNHLAAPSCRVTTTPPPSPMFSLRPVASRAIPLALCLPQHPQDTRHRTCLKCVDRELLRAVWQLDDATGVCRIRNDRMEACPTPLCAGRVHWMQLVPLRSRPEVSLGTTLEMLVSPPPRPPLVGLQGPQTLSPSTKMPTTAWPSGTGRTLHCHECETTAPFAGQVPLDGALQCAGACARPVGFWCSPSVRSLGEIDGGHRWAEGSRLERRRRYLFMCRWTNSVFCACFFGCIVL